MRQLDYLHPIVKHQSVRNFPYYYSGWFPAGLDVRYVLDGYPETVFQNYRKYTGMEVNIYFIPYLDSVADKISFLNQLEAEQDQHGYQLDTMDKDDIMEDAIKGKFKVHY